MPRPKGSVNKVTTEGKAQLQDLIDETNIKCQKSKMESL